MWPGKLQCTTSRHHTDMASLYLQQKLILATDLCHNALRLACWRNMIGQRNHIEQVSADMAQIHPLATNDQLPLNESILPVELFDELQISCPSHWDEIGYPGVH